jgi:hypothetical protein
MTLKFAALAAFAFVFAIATPAFAKKPARISGLYCEQAGNNVHVPAKSIRPSIRNRLRKGQRYRFNDPGFGPIWCRAY